MNAKLASFILGMSMMSPPRLRLPPNVLIASTSLTVEPIIVVMLSTALLTTIGLTCMFAADVAISMILALMDMIAGVSLPIAQAPIHMSGIPMRANAASAPSASRA